VSVSHRHTVSRPSQSRVALLGDVCKTTSGGTPSRANPTYFEGDIPWVKSGELPDGPVSEIQERISKDALKNSSAKLFPAGTLLIALYGATVGKLGVLTKAAATNQAVCAIFPSSDLEQKYLFWFLRFKRRALIESAIGGAQPNISQGILRNLEVPLPEIAEQQQAVAEIEKQFSRLDEAVANLKRVKANLKRYKAAVLKAAVEGTLVPREAELASKEGRGYETGEQLLQRILDAHRKEWPAKGKYREPKGRDSGAQRPVPEGWSSAKVDQLAFLGSGKTPAGILDAVRSTGDVPWFKVGDMNHAKNETVMRHAEAWLSESQVTQFRMRVFPEDTLIFPKRGGAISTNKKRFLCSSSCVDLNVMAITPVREVKDYFFVWFNSIDLAKLADGSNIPQINNVDIEPLVVPLPPVKEQRRIVAEVERRMSLIRGIEAQTDASLKRAERLRQSVLAKSFSN
jgi:type I restriction enzyme S subunit